MTYGITNDQYYKDIADAIRTKRGLSSSTKFTPPQMADAISAIEGGGTPIPMIPYVWTRPSDWPDLDSVYNGEKNTLWMTVDATGRFEYPVVKMTLQTTDDSDWTVQTGTIANGVFTAVTTETMTSGLTNTNYAWSKEWTPSAGYYPVIKITASSIKDWNAVNFSASTSAGTLEESHIIEWIGHADYVSTKSVPKTLVHEAIGADYISSATALASKWKGAYNLVALDLSGWKTTNWNITSLSQTWSDCQSLCWIDFSGWDTSNWTVTTLSSAWSNCYSLKALDLSGWDTSNWAVTVLSSTWNNCFSLQSLDLSGWDTSNWAVTTLNATWSNCKSLKTLDVSGWDTENWAVTTLASAWNDCYSLLSLDVSGWDTSNWPVTTISNAWYYCNSLISLNVSGWDTSNWVVTNMSQTWGSCYALRSLDLSGWNTENWAVTNISNTWTQCNCMEMLNISGWDTSNWAVTTMNSAWSNCNSLVTLDLSGWDTSGWAVTSATYVWSTCGSLTTLNLSGWDTTNWSVSNISSIFNSAYSIISLTLPSGFFGFYTGTANISLSNSTRLSRASILSLFNALPTTETSKSLSLGGVNRNKMTAEEIAIATNKGWTVS